MSLSNIKVGDTIVRMLAGSIEMPLKVTEVTETEIKCGPWRFDRETGLELDEEIGWGMDHSGSYIQQPALAVENLTASEKNSLANVLRVAQDALDSIR